VDITEEVRRRIADLTRLAYERGFRDGTQSALVEIERISADDIVEQMTSATPRKASKKKRTKTARQSARKSGGRPREKTNGAKGPKPKTVVVQEALQSLLSEHGKAQRDEVLAVAQATNPAITKFDLNNGLRVLLKQSKVQVSPENSRILLPM